MRPYRLLPRMLRALFVVLAIGCFVPSTAHSQCKDFRTGWLRELAKARSQGVRHIAIWPPYFNRYTDARGLRDPIRCGGEVAQSTFLKEMIFTAEQIVEDGGLSWGSRVHYFERGLWAGDHYLRCYTKLPAERRGRPSNCDWIRQDDYDDVYWDVLTTLGLLRPSVKNPSSSEGNYFEWISDEVRERVQESFRSAYCRDPGAPPEYRMFLRTMLQAEAKCGEAPRRPVVNKPT